MSSQRRKHELNSKIDQENQIVDQGGYRNGDGQTGAASMAIFTAWCVCVKKESPMIDT
jgi:hypothetical protein